jgi:hypothetical protein
LYCIPCTCSSIDVVKKEYVESLKLQFRIIAICRSSSYIHMSNLKSEETAEQMDDMLHTKSKE